MAIYYVRPNGSNTNTGLGYTSALAWATISKAASVMVAGDILRVAPSTYRETVALANSGSSGLPITYYGDRKCEYFLDMTMGDVIISGLNAENDAFVTRTTAITGAKNYINIINIDVENIGNSSFQAVSLGTYCNVIGCNLTKGINGNSLYVGAYSTIENCKAFSVGNSAVSTVGTSVNIINSILKSGNRYDVVYCTGAFIVNLYHCILEGCFTAITANSTVNLYGCLFSSGGAPSTSSIATPGATCHIPARGSTFIGRSSGMVISDGASYLGCTFKNFEKVQALTNLFAMTWCQFEDCTTGLMFSLAGGAINNCYFKNCATSISASSATANNCRFYGNNGYGGTTINTPVYGETDVVAGVVASATNPISGTKSLKIAGYDYGTVFTQWIPCEAGKAKTVKLKVKKNSATGQCTVRLGDQVVNCPIDTVTNTITVTYTHHKTELVPLFINTRCNSVGGDFVQYDDIAA
jgi:hypothetical protein